MVYLLCVHNRPYYERITNARTVYLFVCFVSLFLSLSLVYEYARKCLKVKCVLFFLYECNSISFRLLRMKPFHCSTILFIALWQRSRLFQWLRTRAYMRSRGGSLSIAASSKSVDCAAVWALFCQRYGFRRGHSRQRHYPTSLWRSAG